MTAATATARKKPGSVKPTDTGATMRLMAEMGSEKGWDPIPPDQYLYFLGKHEAPLQRLLALVRKLTIGRDARSPYCMDENGKEVRSAHLEKMLGMDHGNFQRALKEAVERKLIRVGSRSSPSQSPLDGPRAHRKVDGASAHPHRVYLLGSVPKSAGYKEGEEKGGVCTDSYLTPAQKEIVTGWPEERRTRFYAEFETAVKFKRQIEADAIALARVAGDRALDQVLSAHALPKRRLPKRREPESAVVKLELLTRLDGSVQTQSVQTHANESVQTGRRESVRTSASLLSLEDLESLGAVGRSVDGQHHTDPPADRPISDRVGDIKTLLNAEYGPKFHERATVYLCRQVAAALGDAPVDLLRELIRRKMSRATGMGFAVALAQDVGTHWRETQSERDQSQRAQRSDRHDWDAALEKQRRDHIEMWRATLADPQASAEDKRLAAEFLEGALDSVAAKSAGGAT